MGHQASGCQRADPRPLVCLLKHAADGDLRLVCVRLHEQANSAQSAVENFCWTVETVDKIFAPPLFVTSTYL